VDGAALVEVLALLGVAKDLDIGHLAGLLSVRDVVRDLEKGGAAAG
jgi:hypothetical protein